MIHMTSFSHAAVGPVLLPAPVRIDTERKTDLAARETLLDAAFGPARFAKTCERLRENRLPARELALVARRGDALVGTLRFWHIDAGGMPALLLGPLAVAAAERGAGIGGALMRDGLARAAVLGHAAVLLVGDAPYYTRFGFAPQLTARLVLPGPVDRNRFLARELMPGALAAATGPVRPTGALALRSRRRLTRTTLRLLPAA